MKKSGVFFASCAVLVTMASAIGSGLPDRPLNLGFEEGAKFWRVPGPAWRVEDGAGRGGGKGLVWENSDPKAYSFPAQRIKLESGGIYRFGCRVKIDELRKDGKPIAPYVSMDWSDANGRWIACVCADPVIGNEANTDGWVRYEGVAGPLDESVTQGSLLCYLARGATGKVRFDDFSFKPESQRMVDWVGSSTYRDSAAGGKVTFHAALYVNTVKHPMEAIEPRFSYTASDGRKVQAAPDAISSREASITLPVDGMAKGRQTVEFTLRDRRDGKELGRGKCGFTRGPSVRRRVMFDSHGRTIVDGKPFLPLGMYASALTADDIAHYTNGVFNCVMPYSPPRDRMDAAFAAGIKVIYNLKDMVWGSGKYIRKGCETREKSLKVIREEVERLRNHPALLAWYINDEAKESQIEALREVYAMIRELDPEHPIWAVTDKTWHVRPFIGSYDCIGMDPYPIGNNRGGIDIAGGWALEARRNSFDIIPMWHVPQAFNWNWFRRTEKNPEFRFPTRDELDSMFWQAIAAGANGLVPFAFFSIRNELKGADYDKAMGDVVDVMAAVKRRESIILSDPGPSAVTATKHLLCRTWTTGTGERWLLLSNANRNGVSGTVKLGERFADAIPEKGLKAKLSAPDVLSVELGPLASGFVKLVQSAGAR